MGEPPNQSVLDPAGPAAEAIAGLGWVMFGGATVILLLVLGLAAFAIAAPPHRRQWLAGEGIVVAGGVVLPVAVLSALLVWGLWTTRHLTAAQPDALRIQVVGEQWWWRVVYPEATTANEIRIPAGREVELVLTTADVIHSLWVPSLAGKLDMIPGHENRLRLRAETPGVYRGQCAEFCGGAHALMAFTVVALPSPEFDAWLAAEARPAAEPGDDQRRRGREVFLRTGCGACHTVRGTAAAGVLGPDLTHVGGRASLAAGILVNNQGTLAAWIADAQHLKPGNRMPSFPILSGEDLRAVAAWLESLK